MSEPHIVCKGLGHPDCKMCFGRGEVNERVIGEDDSWHLVPCSCTLLGQEVLLLQLALAPFAAAALFIHPGTPGGAPIPADSCLTVDHLRNAAKALGITGPRKVEPETKPGQETGGHCT